MHIRTTRKNTSSTVVIICVKRYHKSEISLLIMMCIDLYASSRKFGACRLFRYLDTAIFSPGMAKERCLPNPANPFAHNFVICCVHSGPWSCGIVAVA